MIDLKQKELTKWQQGNFGNVSSEKLALGMAEEVGELCHALLKRNQKIREGATGNDLKPEVADAFADCMIYGIQLMENEEMDAECILASVISKVLKRDWVKYPVNGVKNE